MNNYYHSFTQHKKGMHIDYKKNGVDAPSYLIVASTPEGFPSLHLMQSAAW